MEPPRITLFSTPRDVVNPWQSPKNARLRGKLTYFQSSPVVALLRYHRKVTRDDRKYVCVQSPVQMKSPTLWPSFLIEFYLLIGLFLFFWIFKVGTVRIDKVLLLRRKRWIPAMTDINTITLLTFSLRHEDFGNKTMTNEKSKIKVK